MRRKQITRWIVGIATLVALGLIAWRWGGAALALFRDRTAIQAWIVSFGVWAPLVCIALNAAQVIAAPIPGQVIGLANGYLFGVWLGTLYSLLGVMLGTGIVLILTRRWGRPLVVKLVSNTQLEKLDRLVARRGALFFFLIFLLPFLPDDLTCFAIGLTDLRLGQMFALIAIGRLPGLIVASWVGAKAASLSITTWIVLVVAASALALAYMRWSGTIESALMSWIEHVSSKR
ncbi:MAG: VTT domain-containing protein [Methanoregulaceae archaeon]|nr:VTT domain-containing protein [Methanoregulaceae archaeon]